MHFSMGPKLRYPTVAYRISMLCCNVLQASTYCRCLLYCFLSCNQHSLVIAVFGCVQDDDSVAGGGSVAHALTPQRASEVEKTIHGLQAVRDRLEKEREATEKLLHEGGCFLLLLLHYQFEQRWP